MKSTKSLLLASLLLALTPWSPLPAQMNYQGRLTDVNGDPLPGNTATIRFSLHNAITGGDQIWGPFDVNADIIEGRFNVILGPLDATNRNLTSAFASAKQFLQITLFDAGNQPITPALPRQEILPAPSALRANTAGTADLALTVPDGTIGTAKIAANAITTDKIANGSITAAKLSGDSGAWAGSGGNTYVVNGNIGIGTTNPGAKLDVMGNIRLNNNTLLLGGVNDAVNGLNLVATPFEGPRLFGFSGGTLGTHNGTNALIWNSTGRVGILTPPRTDTSLTVQSAVSTYGLEHNSGTAANAVRLSTYVGGALNAGQFGTRSQHPLAFFVGDSGTAMVIGLNNNVGIGTSNPTKARLEVESQNSIAHPATFRYGFSGSNAFQSANQFRDTSIYASDDILAAELRVFSDQRIKKEIHPTNNAADLQTLNAIQISDYQYIDTIAKGNGREKKVIAQQVESVYPVAVSQSTDTVPDIFKNAETKDGWVLLPTNLKPNERVRLLADKGEVITEVLEVRADAFRPAALPEGGQLFVYGREVKDFRTVDYDAISMLNVSATQELARQVKEKDAKIAALEDRLAALEKSVAILAAAEAPGGPVRKETAGR